MEEIQECCGLSRGHTICCQGSCTKNVETQKVRHAVCEDPGSILAGTSHRVTGQKVEDCGPSSFTATVTGQDAWRRAGHRQPSCHCGRGGCDLHNSNPTGFTSNFFARCGASRSCSRAAQEGIFLKDLVSSLSTLGRRAGSPAYGQIIHRRSKLQNALALEPNCVTSRYVSSTCRECYRPSCYPWEKPREQ